MSLVEDRESSTELDDIFNLLKKTRENSKQNNKDSETKDKTEVKNKKDEEYEQLKKKVTSLPSIELHLFKKEDDKNNKKSNNRKILKIDDSVESILPNKSDKTIIDRRLIKEQNSNKWFSLPKVEMTDEIKRDLLIIKNRKYLDPKRFYRGEKWEIPENFQMGEIVEGVGEYGGKIKRKQRGATLVDELLKDDNTNNWFSKTFNEIQVKKKSGGKKFLSNKIEKRKRR
ncbi:Fcf2 protein [Pichia kluyveri]|uniref:Fcf2 protein n=1 Tax=Pichia kluyveri TaxID=36015 RepID=A0AAV5R738_PICKL|nr:Fcf2 protein [Pichia kluyveri]